MTFVRCSVVAVLVGVFVWTGGCGGSGQKPTARVKGKVTFNGQPVTGGNITLSPVVVGSNEPGKSATGSIGTDGTFTLTTYQQNDGAIIGKHRVTFSAPVSATEPGEGHTDEAAAAAAAQVIPYIGLQPKTSEVEVKAGDNSLDIELAKPGA
jgi:hypothetical protein